MVESVQNQLIYQFKQFIIQEKVEIPDIFMVKFVENYLNKDRMFTSDYIYDWFGKQYYTRYDTFTRALVNLLPQTLYQTRSVVNVEQYQKPKQHGGQNKIIYDVSYKGMKMLAIHNDPQTALYYLELEDLVFKFFEHKQAEEIKKYQITIEQLKQHCIIYRINIYDEQGNEIEKYYVGSTTKQKQRLLAHYYDSSNPHVNELLRQGRKVTYTVLFKFEYLFKSERNQIEQRYIDKIPKEKSLNIKSVSFAEIQEEPLNELNNQAEIILSQPEENKQEEQYEFNDLNVRQRKQFEERVLQLKQFIIDRKRYPNKRDEHDELSKTLGYFVSDIRSKYTNKSLHISKERIDFVNEQIPGFVWETKRDTFTKKVDELKEFYDTNRFWPRRNHSESSDSEKVLGKFVAHVRESYQKMNDPNANVPYKLDNERLQYLFEMIPDFVFSVDKEGQYVEIAKNLNIFIQNNQKLPRRSGKDRDQNEVTLGSFLHNLQQGIKLNRSTVPDILNVLDENCPLFDYKKYFKLQE